MLFALLRIRRLRPVLLALLLPLTPVLAAQVESGTEVLFLDVCRDGACGGIALVIVRDQQIWAERGALQQAGIKLEGLQTERIDEHDLVRIDNMDRGSTASIDRAQLRLDLTIPAANLPLQRIAASKPSLIDRGDQRFGGFLNYALNLGQADERGIFLDGAYGRGDTAFRSTAQWDQLHGWQRGLSRVEIDRPQALQRWTFGDQFAITRDSLGGALLMGGAGVERAFDQDPFVVLAPQPMYTGVLDAPGTVEIYANGVLVQRQELSAGPFSFDRLGLTPGRSDVEVVFRDPFGGRRELDRTSYYSGSSLLAAGLSDYALRVGKPRSNGGFGGGYAGDTAFQGWYRRGIREWLTLGGRLEGDRGLTSGSIESAVALPAGEISLTYASSRQDQVGHGDARALAYNFSTRRFGFALGGRRFDPAYRNLQQGDAAIFRTSADRFASIYATPGERWSVQLNWSRNSYADQQTQTNLALSGSYRLGGYSQLLFGIQRHEVGGVRDRSAFLSLNLYLGRNSLTAGAGHAAGETAYNLDVRHSRPLDVGLGYSLDLQQRRGTNTGFGQVEYQGRYGQAAIEAEHFGADGTNARLLLSGALVGLGGRVFATAPIENGFALVRTGELAGIGVQRENNEIGRTDAHGDLLVRNMLPFYPISLKLDATQVPFDYRIDRAERRVAVARNTGAVVSMPVAPLHAVAGRFVVRKGDALQGVEYGVMTIAIPDQSRQEPLGGDGRFYLEDLAPGNYDVLVENGGERLRCPLKVPEAEAGIAQLGDQLCVQAKEYLP